MNHAAKLLAHQILPYYPIAKANGSAVGLPFLLQEGSRRLFSYAGQAGFKARSSERIEDGWKVHSAQKKEFQIQGFLPPSIQGEGALCWIESWN